MIEKVAIALAAERDLILSEGHVSPDKIGARLSKSAIEAMREPTEEMLTAFYGTTPKKQWLGKNWQDMIDAALNE